MKVKEIKNYCLHGVYLLFHNKSDTLHYLFAIPSAFTDHQCRHKDVASLFRGVKDRAFFLFRLSKIYA